MPTPRRAKQCLKRASSLAVVAAWTFLAGCGSTSGADASPIPSTGVPMAAREARGVKVADPSAPFPTTPSELDPFVTDPFGNPHPPSVVPTVSPLPQPSPPDPFATPPDAPSAVPPLTPPPPKPPPTGVPL